VFAGATRQVRVSVRLTGWPLRHGVSAGRTDARYHSALTSGFQRVSDDTPDSTFLAGGKGGIRTHGGEFCSPQSLSRRPLSTSQAPSRLRAPGRRGRDSNPRGSSPCRFQDGRLQPLGHLSAQHAQEHQQCSSVRLTARVYQIIGAPFQQGRNGPAQSARTNRTPPERAQDRRKQGRTTGHVRRGRTRFGHRGSQAGPAGESSRGAPGARCVDRARWAAAARSIDAAPAGARPHRLVAARELVAWAVTQVRACRVRRRDGSAHDRVRERLARYSSGFRQDR
jgi:hypothetical protein